MAKRDVLLRAEPIRPLLEAGDVALAWCTRRDLLGEAGDASVLWELPTATAALRRQRADGSWAHRGSQAALRGRQDYDQLATCEALLPLVYQYRLDRRHPAIGMAAEFLLGFQTEEGDLRGLYAAQYTPNYTAAILCTLIDAGCGEDPRVEKGIRWLLSLRQDDGGWALPWRTQGPDGPSSFDVAMQLPEPLPPDRSQPSSNLITGIVLRALVAYPRTRGDAATKQAASLLASRFFRPDRYPDRRAAAYWQKLRYPFRWNDILSALDSISRLGIGAEDERVERALRWLAGRQNSDGLWRSSYQKAADPYLHEWVSFASARVLLASGLRTAPIHPQD